MLLQLTIWTKVELCLGLPTLKVCLKILLQAIGLAKHTAAEICPAADC